MPTTVIDRLGAGSQRARWIRWRLLLRAALDAKGERATFRSIRTTRRAV